MAGLIGNCWYEKVDLQGRALEKRVKLDSTFRAFCTGKASRRSC